MRDERKGMFELSLTFSSEVDNMLNQEMPLPDNTPLDFWECYAKIVLEEVCPTYYKNLAIKDKPDLQFLDGSKGIEVTQAIDPDQQRAESLYSKIVYNLIRDEEGAKEEIKKCGCEYKDGMLIGKPGTDSFDFILNALERKLKKINKGGYVSFDQYELFIFSDIYSDDEMRQNAINSMIEISNKYNIIFNKIIILVPKSLYFFDLKNRKCQDINTSNILQHQMTCLARRMVEDNIEKSES